MITEEKNDKSASTHAVSERFVEHVKFPKNMGTLAFANASAKVIGSCGDAMEVQLRIVGKTICDIKCVPDGCLYTRVCASAMSEQVKGRVIESALEVDPEDVADALGGLPEDHMHCARLAVNTLAEAVGNYFQQHSYWEENRLWAARVSGGQRHPESCCLRFANSN